MRQPQPPPGSLEAALINPDPAKRIESLTTYLAKGEERLQAARRARIDAVRACRDQNPPMTWRRIAEASGTTEGYWRNLLRDAE